MATLRQISTRFTGLAGLPGLTTVYADPAMTPATFLNGWSTFWAAVAAACGPAYTINCDSFGNEINDGTGALTGSWSGGAFTPVGGAGGDYAAGVGATLQLHTGVIVGRRRLIGRIPIVPMTSSAYQSDGTIKSSVIAAIDGAFATFMGGQGQYLRIWHRPKGGSGGTSAAVSGGQTQDHVSTLKSRRY